MSKQNDYEGIQRHWPDYEIVGELGSGGYGKVYEIRKNNMGHVASSAVKIIHIPRDKQSANELRSLGMTDENITSYYEKQVTAFQNENLLMEKLKSASNIVTIEDSKVEKNANGIGYTIYIKMELLTSMDYLLMNHMLNSDDIATIANDVCAALIACEQLSIVHRDIKPANIFINEFGTFKLGDFGVARQMQNERTNMTQIGTSQYMAPELYSGTKADRRVDIYSLGIMLYRLANYGCFPFVTPDEISPEKNQEALAKRLSGASIPLPPQVDKELGRIIVKACANDPNQRYQSARELKKDINRWQAIQEYQIEENTNKEQKVEVKQEPTSEAKVEPKQVSKAEPKRNPMMFAIIGIILVFVVGGVAFFTVGNKNSDKKNAKNAENTTAGVDDKISDKESTEKTSDEESTEKTSDKESANKDNRITANEKIKKITVDELKVGDYCTLGEYQGEKLEWRILEVKENGKALLISEKGLDAKAYNNTHKKTTWENCSLREWLNESFYTEAFSDEEKEIISKANVKADQNPSYDTNPGNDTEDNVFLLSGQEVKKYFSNKEDRMCLPSLYAKDLGVYIDDIYKVAEEPSCCWWLRSPGGNSYNAMCVGTAGNIFSDGFNVITGNFAVRPALWINP